MRLNVFVNAWEFEEEGWILRVGDDVLWWLVFVDVDQMPVRWDRTQEVTGLAEPVSWEGGLFGRFPTRLVTGSAALYWDAPGIYRGEVVISGAIHRGDATGDTPQDWSETAGVVRRIRLERVRRFSGRDWRPIAGSRNYEDVDETVFPPQVGSDDDDILLTWTGALVELEIAR